MQRVEVNATPPPPVGSVLVEISPDVTLGGDHVGIMDIEQVELVAAKRIKLNPQKWVKKLESQIGELDKLKLKAIFLHDDIDKKAHLTQPVRFVDAYLVSIA